MANVTLTPQTMPMDDFPAAFGRFRHVLRDVEWDVDRLAAELRTKDGTLGEFPIVHGAALHCDSAGTPRVHLFGNAAYAVESVRSGWRDALLTWSKHDVDSTVDLWCEMPGVAKKDIDMQVSCNTINIEARGRFYNYRASCTPGCLLDPERVDARYENGLLEATVCLDMAPDAVVKRPRIA